VKLILAILTALSLVGTQLAIPSGAAPAKACCSKCDGQCCIKDSAPPVSGEPLAPVPSNAAPSVELIFSELASHVFVFCELVPPPPVLPEPISACPQPLFQRFCTYLI